MIWSKIPWRERKGQTVHCHDATDSSLLPKVRTEVFAHFHAGTVKRHSSMWN
jgi:hypothetical protein